MPAAARVTSAPVMGWRRSKVALRASLSISSWDSMEAPVGLKKLANRGPACSSHCTLLKGRAGLREVARGAELCARRQDLGHALANQHTGGHGGDGDDARHHRAVGNAQVPYAVHTQLCIDHGLAQVRSDCGCPAPGIGIVTRRAETACWFSGESHRARFFACEKIPRVVGRPELCDAADSADAFLQPGYFATQARSQARLNPGIVHGATVDLAAAPAREPKQ